jgi:anthrone oxygenase-like protein
MLAAVLLLIFGDLSSGVTTAVAIGLVCAISIAFLSMAFNMPKNRVFAKWDSPRPEYDAMFSSWNRIHVFRVLFALSALIAFAIAAVQY